MRFMTRRVITNLKGDPYLVRLTLFSCRLFGIFVHKIIRSDEDRDLHDHPWPFWTFLLWGSYKEEVPLDKPPMYDHCGKMIVKSRTFGPGSLVRHRAGDCHRLELSRPVWTLFMHGPRKREWGFYTSEGWVPWRQYIEFRSDVDLTPMEDC